MQKQNGKQSNMQETSNAAKRDGTLNECKCYGCAYEARRVSTGITVSLNCLRSRNLAQPFLSLIATTRLLDTSQ